jgi:hypothetical protein
MTLTPRDLSQAARVPLDDLNTADLDAVPMAAQPSHAARVLVWLLACSRHDLSAVPYRLPADNTAVDGYFGAAAWQARAFAAYQLVRAFAGAADRARLDAWFVACARWHAAHVDHHQFGLGAIFPRRLQGDYTARAGQALTGALLPGRRTHSAGQPISWLSMWWNNRRSMCMLLVLLVAVAQRDAALLASVRRYVTEWVTYSVYPDGAQGEWSRNGDYNVASAGVAYGAHNVVLALLAAHWLADLGDTRLLHLRTTAGLWGTESPRASKSIWTALDAWVTMLDGSVAWRNDAGQPFDQLSAAHAPGGLRHASWVLPVVAGQTRYAPLHAWAAAPMTGRVDDPYGLWRGVCGIYLDVRQGANTAAPRVPAGGGR